MKIAGRCRTCKREFPIDLVVAPPETAGRCPFCGKSLDPDYAALLVESLARLQALGSSMHALLERAKSVGDNLELDAESVLSPLRDALGEREVRTAERRATREASAAEPAASH